MNDGNPSANRLGAVVRYFLKSVPPPDRWGTRMVQIGMVLQLVALFADIDKSGARFLAQDWDMTTLLVGAAVGLAHIALIANIRWIYVRHPVVGCLPFVTMLALVPLVLLGAVAMTIGHVVFAYDSSDPYILIPGGLYLVSMVTTWKGLQRYLPEYRKYCEFTRDREGSASDDQMDEWLEQDIKALQNLALKELDLELEQLWKDPICMVSPIPGALAKIGADRKLRFMSYEVTVIFLTSYHLASFQCKLDLRLGTTGEGRTIEYHYRDIGAISTTTEHSDEVIFLGSQQRRLRFRKSFVISAYGGERLTIQLPYLDAVFPLQSTAGYPAVSNPVQLIRARLREMKGGTMDSMYGGPEDRSDASDE